MRQFLRVSLIMTSTVLCMALSGPVSADLLGNLKNQATEKLTGSDAMGTLGLGDLGASLGLPTLGGESGSSIAGILQYCVKNKYLAMTDADNVKSQLLGKLGMEDQATQQQDAGYQQGLTGVLSGKEGKTFDLSQVKDDLKAKACDYALENAGALL